MRADGEMLILDVKRFWRGRYREPMSGAATCGLASGQENQNAIRVRMAARARRKSSWIFGEAFSLAFCFGGNRKYHPGRRAKTPRPQCRPQRRFSLARKRPDVIDSQWSGREDLNLRPPGPEPENSPFLKPGKIRNWKWEAPNHSKRLETKSLPWGNTLSYCFGRNRRRSRLMLVLGV